MQAFSVTRLALFVWGHFFFFSSEGDLPQTLRLSISGIPSSYLYRPTFPTVLATYPGRSSFFFSTQERFQFCSSAVSFNNAPFSLFVVPSPMRSPTSVRSFLFSLYGSKFLVPPGLTFTDFFNTQGLRCKRRGISSPPRFLVPALSFFIASLPPHALTPICLLRLFGFLNFMSGKTSA